MVADVLLIQEAKASATMIFTMQVKWVPAFHKDGFQQTLPSTCWQMIENANTFLYFLI